MKALTSELNMIDIIKALTSELSIVKGEKQNYESNAQVIDVTKRVGSYGTQFEHARGQC